MLGLYLNARNFVTGRLTREEKGATAVEYGIMVALIAVVLLVGVGFFGNQLNDMFQTAACKVQGKTLTAGAAGVAGTCG